MSGAWDFPYAAVASAPPDDDGDACDVVVATTHATAIDRFEEALAPLLAAATFEPLLARAPLFWTRVRSATPARRDAVAEALARRGIDVRYVASSTRRSDRLAPRLRTRNVPPARPIAWRARRARDEIVDPPTDGRWFLHAREGGAAVDRSVCGTGARTRLAVIDDDAAEIDALDLDAEVPIGIDASPRATSHGALMVAWAVGCREGFHGVAPATSPRLYVIPKPGLDVVSLPRAIARATFDGADVIVCATYVEGSTSPMLDDALSVARALGRGGRGAAVVLPTGREASSPNGSVHSSWSLALGDPASDPRALCVGPSARGDGWFLWRDRRGRLRPFANRGPAVRWLAPGDDIAYPFGDRDRLFHAESSGASAIAAGVLLLVLGTNPRLRVAELEEIVTRTCDPIDPALEATRAPLADPTDVLPLARDADGHDAKHGYGRIHARRACLAARDPCSLALVAMGEDGAAEAIAYAPPPCSRALARWAVRAALADASLLHALRAIARHARLVIDRPERAASHGAGALARQVILALRAFEGSGVRRSRRVDAELASLVARAEHAEPAQLSAHLLAALAPVAAHDAAPASPPPRFGAGRLPL